MPATARTLIEGHISPVTVKLTEPLQKAFDLMAEHDFSQLPIVDDNNMPLGLVTVDSILRGVAVVGVTIDKLKVQDVTIPHEVYSHEDNITDILDYLNSNSAVLIIDGNGTLQGIVTHSDAAVYLRRRAQDMMLVEDIELALRDHINAAFCLPNSNSIDETLLQTAINTVFNAQMFSHTKEAIAQYLNQLPQKPKLDKDLLQIACEPLVIRGKELKDLSFYQFSEVLTSRWDIYGNYFGLEKSAIKNMLKKVGEIRNILAHFRDELTPAQRDTLRFCARWFEQNSAVYPQLVPSSETIPLASEIGVDIQSNSVEISSIDEEIKSNESRYAKLANYLLSLPIEKNEISFLFREIEEIIESNLPPSARQHRSWWANDSKSHVQSKEWLDVGWRVATINMTLEKVVFSRMGERAKWYIDSFSQLLHELHEKADFPIRNTSPSGSNWLSIGSYRNVQDEQIAILGFTFARGDRFRVELYIDTGEKQRNKEIFDTLYRDRSSIESGLGQFLGVIEGENFTARHYVHGGIDWERLDHRRASRLAIYKPPYVDWGSDEDKESNAKLDSWAVDTMIGLQHKMTPIMEEMGFRYKV